MRAATIVSTDPLEVTLAKTEGTYPVAVSSVRAEELEVNDNVVVEVIDRRVFLLGKEGGTEGGAEPEDGSIEFRHLGEEFWNVLEEGQENVRLAQAGIYEAWDDLEDLVQAKHIDALSLAASEAVIFDLTAQNAVINGDLWVEAMQAHKIDADQITTGTLDANQVTIENLTVSFADVTGTLTANRISGGTITASDISGVNIDGVTISIGDPDSTNRGIIVDSNENVTIGAPLLTGTTAANVIDVGTITFGPMFSLGWSFNGNLNFIKNDGNNITFPSNTVTGISASDVGAYSSGDQISAAGSSFLGTYVGTGPRVGRDDGGCNWRFYSASVDSIRAFIGTSSTDYAEVRGSVFDAQSAISSKDDVQPLRVNAVQELKNSKAVSYKKKRRDDNGQDIDFSQTEDDRPTRVSVVADDLPEQVKVYNSGTEEDDFDESLFGFDLSGLCAYLVKAVQELSDEIEELKGAN